MSKKILTESTKSKFKILDHKPANVLKRIQGVLSDFKSNRNGRIYPRELWENVLNSDYVKEMIESHGLVGELDHPEERLEISLQNVSHVINDMWIEGDQVLGTIDILPTPSGKIVSELIDYGTDIGISSRGAGSVGAGNIVDPDYQFITFDFVARPSCEAARLNMIVEGVQTEIDNNSDAKVNRIIESYKTGLKEEFDESVFKNYYNKAALPAPNEETLYGYDLSEVCDEVESYYGLENKRAALNYIYEKKLSKKDIDEVMKHTLKEGIPTDFEYIGRDDWGRHIIKSKKTGTYFGDVNLTKAGKDRDLSRASWYTYSGNNPYEGEPEAMMRDDINVNIVNPEKIPTDYQREDYELLSRLEQDCKYFLGNGDGYEGHLWAGSVDKQIAKMRELYDKLEEKPEWLTSEDIDRYEEEMKNYKAGSKNKRYQVIMTLQTSPGVYETKVKGIYDSAEQASDICGELKAQGIGATYKVLDESYEDEEPKITAYSIAQFEAERLGGRAYTKDNDSLFNRDIAGFDFNFRGRNYSCQVSLTERGSAPKGKLKESSTELSRETKDMVELGDMLEDSSNKYVVTDIIETPKSKSIEVRDVKDWRPIYASPISDWYGTKIVKGPFVKKGNEVIKESEDQFKDMVTELHGYVEADPKKISQDLKQAIQSKKLDDYLKSKAAMTDEEVSNFKEKYNLNEAAMSDQDVFKTVLTWYKQQIESGNMTLNQCYELLSDKAKVSLNKMVDQSKIKESMINNTINKLIKESEELNKE